MTTVYIVSMHANTTKLEHAFITVDSLRQARSQLKPDKESHVAV